MLERAERLLRASPGTTLTALVRLACQVRPERPELAFDRLWLRLLGEEDMRFEEERPLTGASIKLFAWTGGDGNAIGFLMDDPDVATDLRPIVKVYGCADASDWEVVAANLGDFLSLVTIACAEVISRTATDDQFHAFRTEWYEAPDDLRERDELASLLLALPGVRTPESPRALVLRSSPRTW